MSRGSKIYRRFGLKYALAYRLRKLKVKIRKSLPPFLQKTLMFLRKTLMFFRILKLKNTNKFQIYKILTQCHCVIVNQQHLEFVARYYKEISSWLESKEYFSKLFVAVWKF